KLPMHFLAACIFMLFVSLISTYSMAAPSVRDAERVRIRERIMSMSAAGDGSIRPFALPERHDRAEALVDNAAKMVRSLAEMEKLGLREVKLEESPWGDDWWPFS